MAYYTRVTILFRHLDLFTIKLKFVDREICSKSRHYKLGRSWCVSCVYLELKQHLVEGDYEGGACEYDLLTSSFGIHYSVKEVWL